MNSQLRRDLRTLMLIAMVATGLAIAILAVAVEVVPDLIWH